MAIADDCAGPPERYHNCKVHASNEKAFGYSTYLGEAGHPVGLAPAATNDGLSHRPYLG